MAKLLSRKSLRERLVSISFGAIVLSMVSITIVFTLSSSRQAQDSLVKDLTVIAQVIGDRSLAALVFGDKRSAERNLATSGLNNSVINSCLYDSNGNLFAHYSVDDSLHGCATSIAIAPLPIHELDGQLEVRAAILDDGETLGFVTILGSQENIDNALMKALMTTFLAFSVIVLFAFLLISRLTSRVLTPLTDLHETALTIAQNPFSSDRAHKEGDDEIGNLVDVFNDMLDKLGSENEALISSENRFRSLAANSPVGIYQMDANRNYTYINEKWHALTQLREGTLGSDYAKFIHEEDIDLYDIVIAKIEETRQSQVLEYRFNAPDKGHPSIFMEHIAPVLSSVEGESTITGFIGSLLDISDLKNAQMELESLAFYDPLTNLPNRRFFKDHLQYVVAAANHKDRRAAILMMDLDNFKKINDTLGHDAGDELLTVLAERLQGLVAKRDVVSRMGGDEFMVLLTDFDMRSSIQRIAERILQSVERPVLISGTEVEVTASIGVATFPEDATTADGLIRNADLALYLSKESGRNRLSFFSKELETQIHNKVHMERDIRDALKSNAFTFFVQPQWCLNTGKLRSGEILIRWFTGDGQIISPNEFIPIAEETGLIIEIGEWLIDRVIASIAENRDKLDKLGLEFIAINLSARQFFSARLVESIAQALNTYQVEPGKIELELTESAVMEDIEMAVDIMQRLKALGCRLSIDDFGTGYSSLSYLKKFPINSVKIDQSFITDIPQDQNDVEISSAIIAMGHNLGLEVVAEGVETQEQMNFLIHQKCDFAQGYYIARPMAFNYLFERFSEINRAMVKSNRLGRDIG